MQEIEAVRREGQIQQGRTKPLVLSCNDHSGKQLSALVKAVGLPEVTSRMIICELIGNAGARAFGCHTAEPFVVKISEQLAATLPVDPGLAAGCRYLRPAPAPWQPGRGLGGPQLATAARIYAFDLMSQNPDRRPDNPNCGILKKELLAYDFGDCFSHLLLPIVGGVGGRPWEVSKHGLAKSHLFWQGLREEGFDPGAARAGIEALDDEWWGSTIANWPPDWAELAKPIRQHVAKVREHADDFEVEVMRSLI